MEPLGPAVVGAENVNPNAVTSPLVLHKLIETPGATDSQKEGTQSGKRKAQKRSAESAALIKEVNKDKRPKHFVCAWLKEMKLIKDFKDLEGLKEWYARHITERDEWQLEYQKEEHARQKRSYNEHVKELDDDYAAYKKKKDAECDAKHKLVADFHQQCKEWKEDEIERLEELDNKVALDQVARIKWHAEREGYDEYWKEKGEKIQNIEKVQKEADDEYNTWN